MNVRLAADEVHGWRVSLDVPPDTVAGLGEILTCDERERRARLRFELDRQRFTVARGALRHVLGCYLGTDPGRLRFVYNQFGKPALSPEFDTRVRFNLSHSADLAFIALALDADVGVDIEYIQPDLEIPFLVLWTRTEACVKAGGTGFGGHPLPRAWSVYPLRPGPEYLGAIAVEGRRRRLRQWQWRC